jgi:tetratricopeptide (TPR) repeat protein
LARECLAQQPKGRHAALARLQLGICLAVRGDAEEAEQVLRANCVAPAGDDPTAIIPQSQLALAMLLRDIGRDAEALAQLDELLSRGADRDVTLEARYLRSECLRRRARRPAARADEAKTEEARAHFRKQQEADVQQAFEQFQQLQRELAVHERSHTATPLELRVLHNTRRALADCLYDLHRYEDALALLDKLAEVYPNPSDWLETQVQIANCYWRLEQPEQYRQVLRAARGRLEAMPVPAREEVRVGMSHARWQEWLDWVKRL